MNLIEYFNKGCKNDNLLGLELEHFIVDKQKNSVPYPKVKEILEKLAPLYGKPIYLDNNIIGIEALNANITLEPAAQLEISIGPFKEIIDIKNKYDSFIKTIKPILDSFDYSLEYAGFLPKSTIDDLPMIPKQRYTTMYNYFGKYGKYMMKGTASTQVSIDYKSEDDFHKKFRVANILSPLFALICDNTRVLNGKPYNNHLARTYIWNNVDHRPKFNPRDFNFREYAEYVYNTPLICMPDGLPTHKTAAEIYEDKPDIEHILSMVFPDIRLKNCIEIRVADSMPINRALEYIALIQGLFYNERNLDMLYDLTKHINDISRAKNILIQYGKLGIVYDKSATEWIDLLYKIGGLNAI